MSTTTTTRRSAALDFPACLLVEMNPDYAGPAQYAENARGWVDRHNRAVNAWRPSKANINARAADVREEYAVLNLLHGLDVWAKIHDPETDYVAAELVERVIGGANLALNYGLGRLDGGTLSSYLVALAERAGVEL